MKSVDRFIEGLCGIPEGDFTVPRVAGYIEEGRVDPDSLSPYLFFRSTHYTRNLIYKCGLFELLAICWDTGQASPIHNHQGQSCWMGVPLGKLAVQNYDVVKIDASGHCELREAERVVMDPGHPSYVDNDRPVHAVLNLPEYGQRAVSLHVYSRPYDHCLVYSMEESTYREVPLFYDSEYGKPASPTIAGR
jgi:cysteine dioxygenase